MLAKTTSQKQRYWFKHVKAADLSDGTIADYVTKTDISLKSLYQWKTKLIRLKLYDPVASSSESDFVPVNSSSLQLHVTAARSHFPMAPVLSFMASYQRMSFAPL